MIQKVKTLISSHKIISAVIFIIVVVLAYFLIFKTKTSGETQYTTQVVTTGSVMSTITGSGQIEASNTINLKTKTNGDINYIGVKAGDTVKKGTLIASVDTRDAKLALENAKITLEKLVDDPDSLTLLQKQNSLNKSYSDGWNTVSSYLDDMNIMVSNLEGIYNGNSGYLGYSNVMNLSNTGKDKVKKGESDYYSVKDNIEKVTKLYKSLSRSSSQEDISNLIDQAYLSSVIMSNTIKDTQTAFNYVVEDLNYETNSNTATTRSNISSWLSSSNNYVNSLLSIKNSLKEDVQSLDEFVAGADELDVKSAKLSVENKQQAYNDCFLYSPFDGVIATFTANVGDSSSGTIGTIITDKKIATISLNEVDVANIKMGQNVTMTFDAISDLTLTGKVVEIGSVGKVSSGVVSYDVSISLDVDDSRVKPGMSVSATIITNIAQDVLVVPNSAVKTKNGVSYVETFNNALPQAASGTSGSVSGILPTQTNVEIGISDDTNTEIISGLKEGDIIVTKTIKGTVSTSTSSSSLFSSLIPGGNRNNTASKSTTTTSTKSASSKSSSSFSDVGAGGPPRD